MRNLKGGVDPVNAIDKNKIFEYIKNIFKIIDILSGFYKFGSERKGKIAVLSISVIVSQMIPTNIS